MCQSYGTIRQAVIRQYVWISWRNNIFMTVNGMLLLWGLNKLNKRQLDMHFLDGYVCVVFSLSVIFISWGVKWQDACIGLDNCFRSFKYKAIIARTDKSDVKCRNTLGCRDQYTAPNSRHTGGEWHPPPPPTHLPPTTTPTTLWHQSKSQSVYYKNEF